MYYSTYDLTLFTISIHTELAKTVCPRLGDSGSCRGDEFTQPRTNFFVQRAVTETLLNVTNKVD